jgi:integrase
MTKSSSLPRSLAAERLASGTSVRLAQDLACLGCRWSFAQFRRPVVKDIHERWGVKHLRIHGKGGKLRNIPAHPGTLELISDYLEAAGHGGAADSPLFRPVRNNRTGRLDLTLTPAAVYFASPALLWTESRHFRRAAWPACATRYCRTTKRTSRRCRSGSEKLAGIFRNGLTVGMVVDGSGLLASPYDMTAGYMQ